MRNQLPIQFDEDVRFMVQIRDGDRCAYDQVYQRYFSTVASFILRHGGRSGEDLAQEVFTRVWRRRAQYQPLGSVRNYLLGIAANVLREHRGAKGRSPISLDMDDLEAVEDTSGAPPSARAESSERIQAVRVLMVRLSPRQRQAVELVYLAGLGPAEAARRLGCSVKTLHVHLCKARHKLRKLARPDGESGRSRDGPGPSAPVPAPADPANKSENRENCLNFSENRPIEKDERPECRPERVVRASKRCPYENMDEKDAV
jgi:RNA polymerase sigma-70 factor (ECF subfamily)